MFGLGFWEIMIVLVAIVVFIRPKDLPGFVRKVGHLYGQVRKFGTMINDQMEDLDQEIRKETRLPQITDWDDQKPADHDSRGESPRNESSASPSDK